MRLIWDCRASPAGRVIVTPGTLGKTAAAERPGAGRRKNKNGNTSGRVQNGSCADDNRIAFRGRTWKKFRVLSPPWERPLFSADTCAGNCRVSYCPTLFRRAQMVFSCRCDRRGSIKLPTPRPRDVDTRQCFIWQRFFRIGRTGTGDGDRGDRVWRPRRPVSRVKHKKKPKRAEFTSEFGTADFFFQKRIHTVWDARHGAIRHAIIRDTFVSETKTQWRP